MTIILKLNNPKDIDMAIIPQVIYNETINMQKEKIQNYFILHPGLLLSFVGFNSQLKQANQLAYNKKCGCYYKIPWKTHYAYENNINSVDLSFSQQVDEYRYMILYWKPSPELSYMQYLSQIALNMLLEIKTFSYYRTNNLEYCTLFTRNYYKNNFKNAKTFLNYINTYIIDSYNLILK
jgi:plasmid replication initiation protein